MQSKAFCAAAALLVATSLAGCASTVIPHPEYVSAGLAAPLIDGKAVIVMDQALRNQVLTTHPTSFTGSATTLAEPVGPIIAMVGEKIFDAGFSGGSEVASQGQPGAYNVTLRMDGFSYAYDQLSSLSFAVTPKVSVTLSADATGPAGAPLLHKSYSRTDFTTGSYVASLQPAEKINQGFHLALSEIFREMLDDLKAAAGR